MNTKRKNGGHLFYVGIAILLAISFVCSMCESKKEFDYWQYVDWEQPGSPDDHTDGDAGADGGDTEDIDGGMID